MPDIECPSCGTITRLAVIARTADEFCAEPGCDFPLFWAPVALAKPEPSGTLDTSLKRLPGTAGRIQIATINCPQCVEPNPVRNEYCLRCGALLRPEPEPELLPPPPPPVVEVVPPPPPPKRVVWPLVLLALFVVTIVVVFVASYID